MKVERVVEEKSVQKLHMLASKPLANQIRDLKPGQVPRERPSILTLLEDAYLPIVSRDEPNADLKGLQPVVVALIKILKAGEKKSPSVKPSEVRAALESLRSSQASVTIARTWLGSPAGRQMVADAEACTKKTAADSTADLSLKKSIAHEDAILRIIPPGELGCMEVPDHDLEFLGSNVTLAQCQEMLRSIQASSVKLLEASRKWSPTGMEEQSDPLGAHCDNLVKCMFAIMHRVVWGIDAACRPTLVALGDQPGQLEAQVRAQKMKEMAEATTKFQKELDQTEITAKFGAVVTAMSTVCEATKDVNLLEKVRALGVQYNNSVQMLSLGSAAAELGNITEPPAFDKAVKEWVEQGDSDVPYMQKVVNFVSVSSGVGEFAKAASFSSHLAQDLAKLLDEHAFMQDLVHTHASSRIEDVMEVFEQRVCHGQCTVQASPEGRRKPFGRIERPIVPGHCAGVGPHSRCAQVFPRRWELPGRGT